MGRWEVYASNCCALLIIVCFLCARRAYPAETYYEVWRGQGELSTAQRVAGWISDTFYDDCDVPSGDYYNYWVRAVTAETSGAQGTNPSSLVTGRLWLTCPTAAERGTASPLKVRLDLEHGSSECWGTVNGKLYEYEASPDPHDLMDEWSEPDVRVPLPGDWSKEWTRDIDVGSYEPATGTAEVYAHTEYLHGSLPPYDDWQLGLQTPALPVELRDYSDEPPTGVSATRGEYDDKIRVEWNAAPGSNSGFSSAASGYLRGNLSLQVDPGVDVGDGLQAYTVRAVASSEPYALGVFDSRFDGPMHQIWGSGSSETPTMDEVRALLSSYEEARDTHLLLSSDEAFFVWDAHEDGPGIGSWLAGDPLDPLAGWVLVSQRRTDLPFAQVVVPDGETVILSGIYLSASNDHQYSLETMIGQPAHPGDANVDGTVNVLDLGILANNYKQPGSKYWFNGDFNGDDTVNVLDLGLLANNYRWSEAGGAEQAIPEPAALALLTLGVVGLMRRRRS